MEQAAYFAVHILSLTETRMASDIFLLRRMEIAELILSGELTGKLPVLLANMNANDIPSQ